MTFKSLLPARNSLFRFKIKNLIDFIFPSKPIIYRPKKTKKGKMNRTWQPGGLLLRKREILSSCVDPSQGLSILRIFIALSYYRKIPV